MTKYQNEEVGTLVPKEVTESGNKNVNYISCLEEIDHYWNTTRGSIAPGVSGIKRKAGDSVMHGTQGVSSQIRENTNPNGGVGLLLAQANSEFAEGILRLCEFKIFWEALGKSGKKVTESLWAFRTAASRTSEIQARIGLSQTCQQNA